MKEETTQYENGTPFSNYTEVLENIQDLELRRQEKKPCLIIIDGMPSTGKTTIGTHIINEENKICGLGRCDLTKKTLQIGTGTEQFIAKLRPCAEAGYPIIMFDEAGEYNRQGWASKLNKIVNKIMDTYRAYNIIIIMVLHDFQELPKHVWNIKLPTILIHLKERESVGRSRWYDLQDMYWIMHNRKTDIFPEASYDKQTPVFRCNFKNLPLEEAKQLDELSTSAKKEKLRGSEIDIQGLLSIHDIQTILEKSVSWIKTHIKQLKIKEQTIYKKKKYYAQEIIAKLRKEIKRNSY